MTNIGKGPLEKDLTFLLNDNFKTLLKEPTSKNQKATSLWTLGCHKPVIPVVTFLTNSSLKLLKTKGLKLTSMMPLNSIIWIIMHHSRSWSTFTLDSLLTVTNFIHRNLFNHQPFDGLSIIINTIKLLAKKGIEVWIT